MHTSTHQHMCAHMHMQTHTHNTHTTHTHNTHTQTTHTHAHPRNTHKHTQHTHKTTHKIHTHTHTHTNTHSQAQHTYNSGDLARSGLIGSGPVPHLSTVVLPPPIDLQQKSTGLALEINTHKNLYILLYITQVVTTKSMHTLLEPLINK